MVIWKLWVAIWPTTLVSPLEQEVLGQRLKEEVAQLSAVSPFEVKTAIIRFTKPLSFLMARSAVSALTLMEACNWAWSGTAWIVAEPCTLIVLASQQLEVVVVGQQLRGLRMLGNLAMIWAYMMARTARQRTMCFKVISIIEIHKIENEFISKIKLSNQLRINQSTSTLELTCTCPQGTFKVWARKEYSLADRTNGTQFSLFWSTTFRTFPNLRLLRATY